MTAAGRNRPLGRPRPRWVGLALVAVAIMVAGAVIPLPHAQAATVASAPSAPASALSPAATAAAGARTLPPAAPQPLAASGRGLFFSTTPMPLPSSTQGACTYYGVCYNDSNNPSLNLTSKGDLGVAYMAYTNQTPCANVTPYAQTEIGFSASSNLGSTWSSPIYLGNTNCSVANQYVDAWQPTLTSLANGTFVLAYIEYNVSRYVTVPYVYFGEYPYTPFSMTYARLVVTESFDGGAIWTTPTVLNTSNNPLGTSNAFAPERPWAAAFGDTIYLAWMNETIGPGGYNYYTYPYVGQSSTQVHLLVSTNGGTSWGPMINLTAFGLAGQMDGLNPNVLVTPSGELFIAYATNFTFDLTLGNLSYVFTTDVEVAASTNNGSLFTYTTAASGILASPYRWGPAVDPSPQMAYSAARGQLYLIYGAATAETVCYSYGYCGSIAEPNVYFQNSSNLGAAWSAASPLTHAYDRSLLKGGFNLYNPSLAVDPNGTVDVEMTYVNLTVCFAVTFGTSCGTQYQIFFNSTDNGTTWSSPIEISGNATGYPYAPDGEYDTMLAAGGRLWIGWTIDVCVVPLATCGYYPSPTLTAQVMISQPVRGAGLTVTFQESGLPSGTTWAVDVLGNLRSAGAPASLSLSGVATGEYLNWTLSVASTSYGTRYSPVGSIASPAAFSTSPTIYENFSEQVLVNISSVPDIPQCVPNSYTYTPCFDNSYFSTVNQNITPGVGANWIDLGASVYVNITGPQYYCTYFFCYYTFENLSFQSWTGTGAGSLNTTQRNISLTPKGPVNETANFVEVGWCAYDQYSTPPLNCLASNATFVFHENNLPTGTNWSVTLTGAFGSETEHNTTPWMTFKSNATIGAVNYTVWTIPGGSGSYYVGTGTPLSPIELPLDHLVNINFTLESPSAATFVTSFDELGLPGGTAWTLNLSGTYLGVRGVSTAEALGGGSYTVGGLPVYLANSTGDYAINVTVAPFVVGEAPRVYTRLPATITLNGSAIVTVGYADMYLLTETASAGGSAAPGSQWVESGQTVTLSATPNLGYVFVGWTGSGNGATSTAQRTQNPVTISPRGPVTELATFMPALPAVWNVTVNLAGLAPGLAGTVGVGNRTLSGTSAFTATGFSSGTYSLTVPFVYLNASDQVRYVPIGIVTTFAQPMSGEVTIGANGFVNVTYAAEYAVTVAATGPGTTTPLPGVLWGAAGTPVTLTAIPQAGSELVGWAGSGSGSVNATSLSIAVTPSGPVVETAQFAVRPIPPPLTYNVSVAATGLPAGTTWSVATGAAGTSGTGPALSIAGLNGTYAFTVPTVYPSPGVRYVPNATTFTVRVTSTGTSFAVSFTEEYLVTITASSGGTVGPGGWIAAGTAVNLSATAQSGNAFDGWNGTGAGAYTGPTASTTMTPTGPVSEAAAFSPIPAPGPAPTSSTAGMPLDLGLLIGLLVVGVVVGWLIGRRRAAAPPPEPTESESVDDAPA